MSEKTQTPQSETTEPSFDEHWEANDVMNRAAQVARTNFIQTEAYDQTEGYDENGQFTAEIADDEDDKHYRSPKSFSKGVAVGVIATTALAGGAALVHEATKAPTFSETTNEYVVTPGDGLYDAAREISGIDQTDIREAVQHISVDPANIDVLKDGLQPGEILVIPDSVQK